MLCSKMSVEKSPLRKSPEDCSLNSSSSSFRGCWAEEMQEKDNIEVKFENILSTHLL